MLGYLFTLSENCSLLGTENVRGQICKHIFAPNGGHCLYIYIGKAFTLKFVIHSLFYHVIVFHFLFQIAMPYTPVHQFAKLRRLNEGFASARRSYHKCSKCWETIFSFPYHEDTLVLIRFSQHTPAQCWVLFI